MNTVFLKSCEDMSELADDSVQCVVTSPPYYGLRDYGTGTWTGGDPACDHSRISSRKPITSSTLMGSSANGNHAKEGWKGGVCGRCGAKREDPQIGLEGTLDEFLDRMVAVFREVRRVLKPDGVCWVNMGDSWAGSWGNQGRKESRGTQRPINGPMMQPVDDGRYPARGSNTGTIRDPYLKPKDQMLVPHRLAIALQEDGWWVRDTIIWYKPNPMPSSVTDRTTTAHEYIFLLTKAPRYYYDADSIRESMAESSIKRLTQPTFDRQTGGDKDYGKTGINPNMSARKTIENMRETLSELAAEQLIFDENHGHPKLIEFTREVPEYGGSFHDHTDDLKRGYRGSDAPVLTHPLGRNKRSVWEIPTEPFPDGHFATFPRELVSLCIRAGSRPGDLVLDPFMGSGTTAEVAESLGRPWVGYEINPEYHELIRKRTRQAGLFTAEG